MNRLWLQLADRFDACAPRELALIQASQLDPDAASRQEIARLEDENKRLRVALDSEQALFVPPAQMAVLLRELIAGQQGLELLSLKAGNPEPLLAQKDAPIGLFRHSLDLELRGSYATLAAYLAHVERLPWRLGFSSLSLRTETAPRANLKLILYTVSLEATWLGL
ncbi:MAG: hypothetical protein CGU28_17060 [Candidatus Dactylopiibacterium carminicum]|uniref:MSHA biogenesis protein MshJ n=1 Tax=Candidatus Dactylopiibacterium carminicum TaxID=857335 RepID=A0A272EMH3_9RHOO|nr:hypothetical protein [Candidatus Dactylopiibacterium carminicum]KAF7597708.1 hypothetical protein BGI27_17340 [Candidatus Dactylopiibacterium carminicum]PAS91317.1 MAG: hypothetical protein CGU29_17140 [Candidatus Dactylopiibacterium carminicum]PAS92066.1 MAG: hypothetical protein CGU28_17060 [Candidatus Dactylopiibacterium carminicum]PAS94513.1 MAG: hypothetical protein BSR46_17380 [Candidatus Dactylopiibacterium carminicum]